jgi:hypothetical protein
MDPAIPPIQPNPEAQPTAEVQQPKIQPTIQPSGLINPNRIYQPQAGQNLVNPSALVIGATPSTFWKSTALDVFGIIFAGAFGYSFARYLAGGISFWFVFAGLLIWGATSVLQGFLQKSVSRRFLMLFFESLALILFFYDYAWQALAITVILVLVCLFWGYLSMRRSISNMIEMRFFTASGKMLGKIVTAGAIFMVVMYASLANDRGNFFVSQNGFDVLFTWAAGFVNNFYPTVPLNGSLNTFAQAVAQMQLQGNPQFQSLSPDDQNAVITQSSNQIIDTLTNESSTDATTTPAAANEPAKNAFYDYLAGLLQKLQTKFSNIFVGAYGLALFLILRSVGIIVVWAAEFVSLIFYELLLATGFMKISEQAATKEVVEY